MASPFEPAPGRGAARLPLASATPYRYLYLVRSRRTNALSIGIDLTPRGECAWACDYCQVPGGHRAMRPDPIELDRLRDELARVSATHGSSASDLTFAGSGEPTFSPSFGGALARAIEAAAMLKRAIPVRVLTCGTMLDFASVQRPLFDLVERGAGEVWIKLDSWDEESMRRSSGTRGQSRHESRITRFASKAPIVVQSTLVHRDSGPDQFEVALGLAGAIHRLREGGAKLQRVFLTTVVRPSGTGTHLRAYSAEELRLACEAIRTITGEVLVLAASLDELPDCAN